MGDDVAFLIDDVDCQGGLELFAFGRPEGFGRKSGISTRT